jgi:hypothetical protein
VPFDISKTIWAIFRGLWAIFSQQHLVTLQLKPLFALFAHGKFHNAVLSLLLTSRQPTPGRNDISTL